jgi:hypothetical protein
MKRAFERELPTIAALAALFAFSLLYLFNRTLYRDALDLWGVKGFAFPFLDTHALLSAIECRRQGMDVFYVNSCDALGRPHVYSPIWLWAAILPLSTAWTAFFGFVLAVGFGVSLRWLPPVKRGWTMFFLILAVLSPMSVYAVERGNNDLIVFIFVLCAAGLLHHPLRSRLLAYALIGLAGLLKFYPFTALALALREGLARFLIIAAFAVVTAAVLGYVYLDQMARVFAIVPSGSYYTDLFGAGNLPYGFVQLIAPLGGRFPSSERVLHVVPYAILLAMLCQWAWQVRSLIRSDQLVSTYARLPADYAVFMTIAGLLLAGCFFTGQSVYYRGVFFLFALPGLFALRDSSASPVLAGRMALTIFLVLLLMWSETIRTHLVRFLSLHMGREPANTLLAFLWLIRELIWWRVIAVLSALALCFATTSEAVSELLARLGAASALPQARVQKLEAMRARLEPRSPPASPPASR